MIREISLVKPQLCRIGPQQDDVQRLDPVTAQLPLGLLDVGGADLLARPFMSQVEHHAIAIAEFDRDALGPRRIRLDVSPRVDVRPHVIAGDDHAVIRDLIDAELVCADAPGHLPVALHLDDHRLSHIGVSHHPLVDFHAQIDQLCAHLPTQPPSTCIDCPVR